MEKEGKRRRKERRKKIGKDGDGEWERGI